MFTSYSIPKIGSLRANDNVDEMWLRYHAYNKKRKTYMWCLINRKAHIVIFFYEDTTDGEGVQKHGGRNRNALKEFLGDAKIKSLQSDGYNVYMYLDNEFMDIEISDVWLMQGLSSSMPTTREVYRKESSLN